MQNTEGSFSLDALLDDEKSGKAVSREEPQIANPPATTIRFDGSEVVLGMTNTTRLAADQFWDELSTLLGDQKYFTANDFVAENPDVAEQLLWEKWVTHSDSSPVRFIANVLSQNIVPGGSWNAMLDSAQLNPLAAKKYQSARSTFTEKLRTEGPSNAQVEQLRTASQNLKQSLAMADTLQLIAISELAVGRNAWAESLFLQAIELAEQNQDIGRVSDLWMMVAVNSSRYDDHSTTPEAAWNNAVVKQCSVDLASQQRFNVRFWENANRYKPRDANWPDLTKEALMIFAKPVGCQFSNESPIELVIWSAIANSQLMRDDPQLALVNFKKAETFATGQDIDWLRIGQSRCLAALGQNRAAAALLSTPLASKEPNVAAAANATLGSTKLNAGAYQQGAQFLTKALVSASHRDWPTKSHAEADLALAMLIIGETTKGLKSLHAAQSKFEAEGDYVSLLQSLENELRLLEQEGNTESAASVRDRILQIESAYSS